VSSKDYREVLTHSHLGVMFMLVVGGSVFLGVKADEQFGSSPWGVLIGLAAGFALGFYYMFVQLFRPKQKPEDEETTEGD
jgi:F0F1-type ATP synthase assembly protein I